MCLLAQPPSSAFVISYLNTSYTFYHRGNWEEKDRFVAKALKSDSWDVGLDFSFNHRLLGLISPAGPQFFVLKVDTTMSSHFIIYSVLFWTSLTCIVEDHILPDLNTAIQVTGFCLMLCLWALQILFDMSVGGPRAALMGQNALYLHVPGQNRAHVTSEQREQLLLGASDLKCTHYQLGSRRAQERGEQRNFLISHLFAILFLQTAKKYTA